MLREFRDDQLAVAVNDRGLGPRAAERRARREQETQIIIAAAIILAQAQRRAKKGGQLEERRNLHAGREKRPAFVFRETQRALAGDIADAEQVIDFEQRARRALFFARLAALFALDQHAPPAIRRGVADRPEVLPSRRGVVRAFAERQRRLKRETGRVGEPCGVVFEGGAFLALAAARPKPADEMRRAFQINIDEEAAIRHAGFLRAMPR